MALRAGVVVTGTEVLTGRVPDRNGPWLAEQLRTVGLDIGQVVVVGDRPEDLLSALTHLAAGHDLLITSGGLGPTADDLTADVVGRFQGRPLVLDEALQGRIAAIIDRLLTARGLDPDPASTAEGTRKQAMVPDGALVLEPVGTAPGLVVLPATGDGPPVVVLPGPPGELQRMWPAALAAEPVRRVIGGAPELRQSTVRVWNALESQLAATLRGLGGALDDLEVTTCLRDGELEIVSRYAPEAQPAQDLLVEALRRDFAPGLFSTDGATVDQIVQAGLLARGWHVATAESCTAGLLSGRLARLPGSSAVLLGGVTVYSNEAKAALAGVAAELIAEHGAVSEPVARALAQGARRALGAEVGIGITGVAGPDGGTADKPVGTVHLALATPDGEQHLKVRLPGDRDLVRQRTTTVALHLLRQALAG